MGSFGFGVLVLVLASTTFSDAKKQSCTNPIQAPPGVSPLGNPLAIPQTVSEYELAVMAGSDGACPVATKSLGESIDRIHYFHVDSDGNTFRDSSGFQYISESRNKFKYDQVFLQFLPYDEAHPGTGQFYESASNDGQLFIDIAVLEQHGTPHCVQAPNVPIPFLKAIDQPESRYIGVVHFNQGDMMVDAPEGYDVYAVPNYWIANTTVLFFYVNRGTGVMDVQLYHQSEGGGPNYFWDFGFHIYQGPFAEALFVENEAYYFSLPEDVVQSFCDSSADLLRPLSLFLPLMALSVALAVSH